MKKKLFLKAGGEVGSVRDLGQQKLEFRMCQGGGALVSTLDFLFGPDLTLGIKVNLK